MRSTIKLFLIAVVIMTSISAYAQQSPAALERVGVESADALPLSLNEAIKLALENNNDIRTSRINVENLAAFFELHTTVDSRPQD